MDSTIDLNIKPITKLSSFIQNYPDQSLHQHIKILQQSFPNHRAVKGDGNCFYRCFAFLYLVATPCINYNSTFPKTTWNCYIQNSSIQSDQQFQRALESIWNRYIKDLSLVKSKAEKQQKLQNLFNKAPLFDQLIIGYFRSINYQQMIKNKNKLLPFAQGDINFSMQLQRITQFGAQSQGIQIYNLANIMQIKITIFCIDRNGFQPISYMDHLENKDFYLFFRPGHYDIVYPFQKIQHQLQNNSLIKSINTTTFQSHYQQQKKISVLNNSIPENQKNTNNGNYHHTTNNQTILLKQQYHTRKAQIKYSDQSSNSNNSGKFDLKFKTIDTKSNNKDTPAQKLSSSTKKNQKLKITYINDQPSIQRLLIQLSVLFIIIITLITAYKYLF